MSNCVKYVFVFLKKVTVSLKAQSVESRDKQIGKSRSKCFFIWCVDLKAGYGVDDRSIWPGLRFCTSSYPRGRTSLPSSPEQLLPLPPPVPHSIFFLFSHVGSSLGLIRIRHSTSLQ